MRLNYILLSNLNNYSCQSLLNYFHGFTIDYNKTNDINIQFQWRPFVYVMQTVPLTWHVWEANARIPANVGKMPSALSSSTGPSVPASQVMREIQILLVHLVRLLTFIYIYEVIVISTYLV